MITFSIGNNKLFMNHLLKENLFDSFEVRKITLHTFHKLHMGGARNMDFYTDFEKESLSEYISWREIKPYIFDLIKGKKSPTYFKIILSTSSEDTKAISSEISTFFLNITYKENIIQCTTGTAYSTFSLDKTPESLWDEKIKKFLISNQLV